MARSKQPKPVTIKAWIVCCANGLPHWEPSLSRTKEIKDCRDLSHAPDWDCGPHQIVELAGRFVPRRAR